MRTAVIILAAGAARRMSQPKMLLPFGNSSILEKLIEEVKASNIDSICLVSGYYHQVIQERMGVGTFSLIFNEQWQSGMASSIVKGIEYLQKQGAGFDSVIIAVSDQPYLNRDLLLNMLQLQRDSGKGIVAASYAGINGTPVLFTKAYFSKLEKLTGDQGARSILQQYPDDLITIDFPLGEIDIDTEEDYNKFLHK